MMETAALSRTQNAGSLICIGVGYWLRLAHCKSDFCPHKRVLVKTERQLGGAAIQTALMGAASHIPSQVLALVGDDNEGREFIRSLNTAGVDSTHLHIQPETSTGWATAIENGKEEQSYYLQDLPERCFLHPTDYPQLKTLGANDENIFIDAVLNPDVLALLFVNPELGHRFVSVQSQNQLEKMSPYFDYVSHLWLLQPSEGFTSSQQALEFAQNLRKKHPDLSFDFLVPGLGSTCTTGLTADQKLVWTDDSHVLEPWQLEQECGTAVMNWLDGGKNTAPYPA